MKISFYPYDFDYRIKDGKVYVYLFGKLEAGGKICVIHEHRPYFFAQIKSIDTKRFEELSINNHPEPAKIVSWEIVEKEFLGKKEALWKMYVNYPKAVPLISKELQSWGINCYEKDILFIHRYLRDMELTPLTLVQVEGDFITDLTQRINVFKAEKISQLSKESLTNPKILAIDIETYADSREINMEKNPILMIGCYGMDEKGHEFKKVITWKKFPHDLDYLEFVPSEPDMLERLREIILDYQPDIITGYNSDGFDFPYIQTRADKYRVVLDLGVDRSNLLIERRGEIMGGKASIRGFLHLDILQFVRNIFGKNMKVDSYTLDSVSEELLGHKKHVVSLDELGSVWDENPEKLLEYCKYNLHDCYLTLELCQKLYFDMVEFTKIVGLPTADVIRMRFSKLVESYILKRSMEFNVLAPNKPSDQEVDQRINESIEGAFVFEPIPGLYQDIIVFDFRSLYPTIISAHNIGPEGFHCSCCKDKPHVPGKEEYWFCQREKKFIPTVLEDLILRRVDLKRLIKEAKAKNEDTKFLEARSYAIKTLSNSFYGYLGFYGARWYCIECAASTTAYARDYIKRTIQKAQERGFQVIYADTDSCFLLLGEKIQDEAMAFMNEINFDLPGHMELDFEGYYPRGIFVALKGSDKGAKKKYALMSEKGKLKITGFETVRRNWSKIAKEIQQHVLKLILSDKVEEAVQYIKEMNKELKKGALPKDKLIIKTQITRELEDYSSTSPHVAVAHRMVEKGKKIVPGTVVEYIIVKGGGIISDRAKLVEEVKEGEYDPDYYLNNQIIPAVSSIFLVLGYSEEDLFKDSSQVGLGKFF